MYCLEYVIYGRYYLTSQLASIDSTLDWCLTRLHDLYNCFVQLFYFCIFVIKYLRDVGNNYVYPSLNRPEHALAKDGNTSLVEFGKTEVFFHLDTLQKHYLSNRKFLCGDVPTLADSWIAIVLSLLELVCLDLTPWPKVKSWMCAMKSNSDYVDVSYNHEEMVRKCLYGMNDSTSDLKTMDRH